MGLLAPKSEKSAVTVIGLYLSTSADSLVTSACNELHLSLDGVDGEVRHPRNFVKPADSRDTLVPRDTPVRNWRLWSAVSIEELEVIAGKLKITDDPIKLAALLGANIVFAGYPHFTHMPRGCMIEFPQPEGAILQVECENEPCGGPGEAIAKVYTFVKSNRFAKAAKGLRGIVGVVYKAGVIHLGATATVHMPG